MKITLLGVGTIKEKHFQLAIQEYVKRLAPYADIKIIEIEEYRLPEKPSLAQIEYGLVQEGKALLRHIDPSAHVTVLDLAGEMVTSVELSKRLERLMVSGHSVFSFIIGSSYGLSEEIKKRADARVSLSNMTFPHQLVRVLVLEQLYRAFKIMRNETYHK